MKPPTSMVSRQAVPRNPRQASWEAVTMGPSFSPSGLVSAAACR
jgi:hypothetical protein